MSAERVGGADCEYAPLGTGRFTGLYVFHDDGFFHMKRRRIRNPFLAWALEGQERVAWTGFVRGIVLGLARSGS